MTTPKLLTYKRPITPAAVEHLWNYGSDSSWKVDCEITFSGVNAAQLKTERSCAFTEAQFAKDLDIAQAHMLGMLSLVELPPHGDSEADQHPWLEFKLTLFYMHDVSLVHRSIEVAQGDLIYAEDDLLEVLSELRKTVSEQFLSDVLFLGFVLQDANSQEVA